MAQISSTHSRRVDKYCSQKQFDNNWDKTFGKKKEKKDEDEDTIDSTESSTYSKPGAAR